MGMGKGLSQIGKKEFVGTRKEKVSSMSIGRKNWFAVL